MGHSWELEGIGGVAEEWRRWIGRVCRGIALMNGWKYLGIPVDKSQGCDMMAYHPGEG